MVAGFQMATAAGPLCDEPMWGVAFEVEARLNLGDSQGEDQQQAPPLNVSLGLTDFAATTGARNPYIPS